MREDAVSSNQAKDTQARAAEARAHQLVAFSGRPFGMLAGIDRNSAQHSSDSNRHRTLTGIGLEPA